MYWLELLLLTTEDGAGLIYTSAKKNINCDILGEYIRHKLYNFEFNHKLQLTEKDCTFVPIGVDSMAKINIDFANQNLTKDPDEPFEDVIKIPKRLQQSVWLHFFTRLIFVGIRRNYNNHSRG